MQYQLIALRKIYGKQLALDDVFCTFNQGEFIMITGESGSGKSTLMNVVSGMDQVDAGKILYKEQDITTWSQRKVAQYRRQDIGFVFQAYHLIPTLTAYENVRLAAELVGASDQCDALLDQVGLSQWGNHFPGQLSGGQQQRVAIARALTGSPAVLFCDEPTGALDHQTSLDVIKLISTINQEKKITIFFVTHYPEPIMPYINRHIIMSDGKLEEVHADA